MKTTLKKTIEIGLLFCSLTVFSQAHAKDCHILVLGDSLSAAYSLPVEHGWVALLKNRLKTEYPLCKLTNASISGETTAGGKTRLGLLLKQHGPSHLILELGANDGLRGLPLATMESNLSHMIQQSQTQGTKVVLLGMRIPPNYGPKYTQQFEKVFETLAGKHQTPLVPFLMKEFAEDPTAFQNDGIHPNAKSQHAMLNTVWPSLQTTLSPYKKNVRSSAVP